MNNEHTAAAGAIYQKSHEDSANDCIRQDRYNEQELLQALEVDKQPD